MPNSLPPCGLKPTKFLCPKHSPGKNTGLGCHALLQEIFLTQELNPHLLWSLYFWATGEAPIHPYLCSYIYQCSRAVMSDSLPTHGLQHASPPCPSPNPGACSNSCPLSQWCHSTISSSIVQSPPAFNLSQHQGLFQMCQFFASGGQSIVVSASTSVLPMNTQDWSPLGWTGWISR